MRGSLGEKIGEGGSADIHAWAPGQVVKLFKPGGERRLSRNEAQMTRTAFAAGLPAPEVFDEVGGPCSTEPITGSSSRATGSIGRICKLAPVDREATTSDASGQTRL